jgi:uncharacterized pyridoxamine 5'-phosphate oxidase family protein
MQNKLYYCSENVKELWIQMGTAKIKFR